MVLVLNAVLAIAYAAFGLVGLSLAVPPGYATLIWPAAGVAMAFMLFYGLGVAPGVFVGSFVVNCYAGGVFSDAGPALVPLLVAFGIAVSSTLQTVFGALVSRRLFGVPLRLAGIRQVLGMAALVGPIACLIAATGGTAALLLAGAVQPEGLTTNWMTWWLGDLVGVAVVLPLALLSPWRPWPLLWTDKPLTGLKVASFVVLLVPIGLTFYAWKLVSASSYERNYASFVELAEDNERALTHRLDSYAQGLDGAAGLLDASEEISLTEWRTYVDALDITNKMPGINGIGFIEPVPEGGHDAFIARYERLGLKGLTLHPETDVQETFAITYIEPMGQNREAVGLNIAFEDNRRNAAITARDTGKASITKRIFLVQDATRSAGFLLLRPQYRIGWPTTTIAERRAAFFGWVYAPFISYKFMEGLSASQGSLFALQVFDGTKADPDWTIYDGSADIPNSSAPRFELTRTIEVYGQNWTLRWSSTPAYEQGVRSNEPALVLAGGLLLSSILAIYLLSLARREASVQLLVEQKTREIAERELENRSLVDTAVIGIMLTDGEGKVLSANRAAQEMFCYRPAVDGLPPVDLMQVLGLDGVFPDRIHDLAPSDGKADTATKTVSVRCRNDKELEVDLQLNQWRTESGDVRYTVLARDVSVEHRMRKALEDAERRWSIALSGSRIGVYDVDLVTGRSVVSDTWWKMLGLQPDADANPEQVWQERLHPDDREMVIAADRACIAGEIERAKTEYRVLHNSGHYIWLQSDAMVAERDARGVASRLVGTQTDITGLKSAEAALMASEERFRSAIENAPIGMALLDLDGHWLTVNDALCEFLGYSPVELTKRSFQELTHPEDLEADLANMRQLLNGEIPSYQLEKRYINKSGAHKWGLLSVSLARDESGQPAYVIKQILDVTHRREVERLQSEFISTVSHELRTPLTAIQGALSLLRANFEARANDKEKKLIANTLESSQRLSRLVNDILDVQKMAEGKVDYDFETADICELVRQVVETQVPFAEKWGIEIETRLPAEALRCRIDKDRFSQALVNLVSNAIKFSDEGEKVIVSADRLAVGGARVAVQDFGSGIPAEFRDRIFGKFAQADGSSTRKTQGSGLGLNITRSIIEAFGGTLDFETESGKGTTFFFDLPAVAEEKQRA